jgi:hypothetical protein
VIDGDLVTSAAVQEENYLVRWILASIGVSVKARQRQFNHRPELLLRRGEKPAVAVEGREGRVCGGYTCQEGSLFGLRGVEGQEHRPGDLSEGLRHPEAVAPLGDDLEKDAFYINRKVFVMKILLFYYLSQHLFFDCIIFDEIVFIFRKIVCLFGKNYYTKDLLVSFL